MIVRAALPATLILVLTLAACRKEEVTSYRVPKEKSPEPVVAAATSASAAPIAATPAATMPATMANTPVATASGPNLTWTAPSHWKSGPPAQMRKGTYLVAGADGTQAELAISAFGGEVGGELANVNRWRGQLQLPPISEGELAAAVQRREHNGLKFGLVDLAASSTGQRVLGAWVPFAGSTWFFKLTGPAALLAKEKAAFDAFVASVNPAGASATP